MLRKSVLCVCVRSETPLSHILQTGSKLSLSSSPKNIPNEVLLKQGQLTCSCADSAAAAARRAVVFPLLEGPRKATEPQEFSSQSKPLFNRLSESLPKGIRA